jgi:hypothetical protein
MNYTRRFFLSEIKKTNEHDLALMIELMRAAHLKVIRKLMSLLFPPNLDEDELMFFQAMNDDITTMLLNISAAQLKEALKLLGSLTNTNFYKTLKFTKKEKSFIEPLLDIVNKHKDENGFLKKVLTPVRNLMFHYQMGKDVEKVIDWINKIKKNEALRKPHHQSINFDEDFFGPGFNYDTEIFSRYLFWGDKGINFEFVNIKHIFEFQTNLMGTTKILVKKLFERERISERNPEWILKHQNGYKKMSEESH